MWITKMIPGTAPDGAPILSVLAKATYRISLEGLEPLPEEERLPLFDSDKLYGSQNPALDPIEHESDLVAYKPMTDIIVHGEACAPTGKRARFFDMGISVRGCVRKLRIFGPRHLDCSNGKIRFSEPEPFERMPLHFGLAYGGMDRWSHPEEVYTYPRNPVGKGFLVSPDPAAVHGLELPNLEDPLQLLDPSTICIQRFDRWPEAPQPRALGYTSRHSYPRYLMQGLSPAEALEVQMAQQQREASGQKASEAPPLLNPQFYNGAAQGLSFPYLWGGEQIQLSYVDPENPLWNLTLPEHRPLCYMDLGRGAVGAESVLHTIEIYPQEKKLTLLWRASNYYAGTSTLSQCQDFAHWAEPYSLEESYGR